MGVIIGAGTHVSFRGNSGTAICGANSVSWSYDPKTERYYQLGSWVPCDTLSKEETTLNLSFYSSQAEYDLSPSTSCENLTVKAEVYPAGCDIEFASITGDWFVTSYSFSKSSCQPANESWSLIKYDGDCQPDYHIRGISEGTMTTSEEFVAAQRTLGIKFVGTVGGGVSLGYEGSVQAGPGSIGKESKKYAGVVSSVGGAVFGIGDEGSSSASIPYSPVWV
jgi:hypothetical protein